MNRTLTRTTTGTMIGACAKIIENTNPSPSACIAASRIALAANGVAAHASPPSPSHA